VGPRADAGCLGRLRKRRGARYASARLSDGPARRSVRRREPRSWPPRESVRLRQGQAGPRPQARQGPPAAGETIEEALFRRCWQDFRVYETEGMPGLRVPVEQMAQVRYDLFMAALDEALRAEPFFGAAIGID